MSEEHGRARPGPPDQAKHKTPGGRPNEWDCTADGCGHSSMFHTVDAKKGLGPLDPGVRFECEVDACACAQLVPGPATLRTLGIHPSAVR